MLPLELNITFLLYCFCTLWLLLKVKDYVFNIIGRKSLFLIIFLKCAIIGAIIYTCIKQVSELLK